MVNLIDLIQLPEWLYRESQQGNDACGGSSTAGKLAPDKLIDPDFQGSPFKQSIPHQAPVERDTKIIIINDFALAFPGDDIDGFLYKLDILEQLIDKGCKLYLLRPDDVTPKALTVPLMVNDFTRAPIPKVTLSEATQMLMPSLPDIAADDVAICTNKRLIELVKLVSQGSVIINQEAMMCHYKQTGQMPLFEFPFVIQGQALYKRMANGDPEILALLNKLDEYHVVPDRLEGGQESNIGWILDYFTRNNINLNKIVGLCMAELDYYYMGKNKIAPPPCVKTLISLPDVPETPNSIAFGNGVYTVQFHQALTHLKHVTKTNISDGHFSSNTLSHIQLNSFRTYLGPEGAYPFVHTLHLNNYYQEDNLFSHYLLFLYLSPCPNLVVLKISNSTIVSDKISERTSALPLPHLTQIDFSSSKINRHVLSEFLKNKPQLEVLKLGKIPPNSLESSVIDHPDIQLGNLTTLDASEIDLPGENLRALIVKTTRLQHLSIHVGTLKTLLKKTDLDNLPLEHILSFQVLLHEKSNTCFYINPLDIQKLLEKMPRVKLIKLQKIGYATSANWGEIPLNDLRVLDLQNCQMPNPWPDDKVGQLTLFHMPSPYSKINKLNIVSPITTRMIDGGALNVSTSHPIPRIFRFSDLDISGYFPTPADRISQVHMLQNAKVIFAKGNSIPDSAFEDETFVFPNLIKLEFLIGSELLMARYIIERAPALRILTLPECFHDNKPCYEIRSNKITHLRIMQFYSDSAGAMSISGSLNHLKKFLDNQPSIETLTIHEYWGFESEQFLTSMTEEFNIKVVIEKINFMYKRHNQPIEYRTSSHDHENSRTTVRGVERSDQIYDQSLYSYNNTDFTMQQIKPDCYMEPVCTILDGHVLPFKNIRKKIFTIDFVGMNENTAFTQQGVPHTSLPLSLTSKLTGTQPANVRFAYAADRDDVVWDSSINEFVLNLWSLTSDDIIIGEVAFGNKKYDPKFCIFHTCHFIILDKKPTTTQSMIFECATPTYSRSISNLPPAIRDLQQSLSQPFEAYTGTLPSKMSMKEMRQKIKHYPCRSRAVVGSFYFQQMKIGDMTQVVCVQSGLHQWVQITYAGKVYTIDLGGSAANLIYVNKPTPARQQQTHASSVQMQSAQIQHPSLPVLTSNAMPLQKGPVMLTTLEALDDHIQKPRINTLFMFESPEDLKNAFSYLISKYPDKTILVKNGLDLQTTKRHIDLQSEDEIWTPKNSPSEYLSKQLDDHQKTHLLIDWSRISVQMTIQNNTCIDANRMLHGKAIGENVHVIGFITKGDPRLEDMSFRSRHGQHIYKIEVAFPASPTPNIFHVEAIELYESPSWMDILFGEILLDKNQGVYKRGRLLQADLKDGTKLILRNPPKNSAAFNAMVKDLEKGNPIRFQNKMFQFPPLFVQIQHGYDFTKRATCIETVYHDVTPAQCPVFDHVLNPETFERLLHNHDVENNLYIEHGGWIDSDKPEMSFFITRTLTIQQYCALRDRAETLHKKLTLFLAPGVTLPPSIQANVSTWQAPAQSIPALATCVVTNHGEKYIDDNMTESDLVVDVSEYTPDDILYQFAPHFHPETNTFSVEHIESPVLTALKNGQTVYLTGHFSIVMIDHLSTLLMPNGYIWQHLEKQPIKGKLILVMPESTQLLNWLSSKKTVIYDTVAHPAPQVYEANEPGDAEGFEEARFDTVLKALAENPAIFIEGEPGIGKSSFIHAFIRRIGKKAFDKNYVVIDESTLQKTHYSKYTGLYRKFPHLALDPQDQHKKFIFLGNHVKDMPALLEKKVAKVTFRALSPDYIIKRIIQPIFAVHNLAGASNFYHVHATKTARELQCFALAHCAARNLKHQANALDRIDGFHIMDLHKKVLTCLLNSLNARHFMLTAKTNEDAPRYGGQTAILIQGPASIGKSTMIEKSLLTLGYTAMTDADLDALEIGKITIDTHDRFYKISAGCDDELMITRLHKAADQGLIVVFDEIDTKMDSKLSGPLVAHLNAFLMGETLDFGRPTKPGFMLIATGNGRRESGRKCLPASIISRCQEFELEAYKTAEMALICGFPETIVQQHINDGNGSTVRELQPLMLNPLPSTPVQAPPLAPVLSTPPVLFTAPVLPPPAPPQTSTFSTTPCPTSPLIPRTVESTPSSPEYCRYASHIFTAASMLTAAFTPHAFYEDMGSSASQAFICGVTLCLVGMAMKTQSQTNHMGNGVVVIGLLSLCISAISLLGRTCTSDLSFEDTNVNTPALATGLYSLCTFSGIVATGFEIKHARKPSR